MTSIEDTEKTVGFFIRMPEKLRDDINLLASLRKVSRNQLVADVLTALVNEELSPALAAAKRSSRVA